jgi:Flp pilus assembly pilin Flp
MQLLHFVRDSVVALLREESGQDTFEYLLIIGGISVAVIAIAAFAAPGLFGNIVIAVCEAIQNEIPGMGGIGCGADELLPGD